MSNNQLKTLASKILNSGSIIYNCLKKYVDEKFNLSYILHYYIFILLFKISKLNFSPQLKNMTFIKSHSHNTRNKSDFEVSVFSRNCCMFGFQFFAPRLWSMLPNNIKNDITLTLNSFTANIELFLKNNNQIFN